jgi:hypothetical protein
MTAISIDHDFFIKRRADHPPFAELAVSGVEYGSFERSRAHG